MSPANHSPGAVASSTKDQKKKNTKGANAAMTAIHRFARPAQPAEINLGRSREQQAGDRGFRQVAAQIARAAHMIHRAGGDRFGDLCEPGTDTGGSRSRIQIPDGTPIRMSQSTRQTAQSWS